MSAWLANLAFVLVSAVGEMWTGLMKSRRLMVPARPKPYRPELHYMRGPGPAWHLRHEHDAMIRAARRAGDG